MLNKLKNQGADILKGSSLSVTSSRKAILDIFLGSDNALAHQDIENIAKKYDRVTIYRTLQTFLEKGIIHSIPTTDNIIKYALCSDMCITTGHHHDNHVHFLCDDCGKTVCLDEVSIPNVNLPKGFVKKEINMVVNGICNSCQK